MRSEASSPQYHRLGVARIALAGLIWGSIPVVLDAAGGPAYVKVFFRVAIAAAVVIAYQIVSGGLRELIGLPPKKWRQLIVQSLVLTLNWLLFFTALEFTTVATTELLGYTGPVFVAALAPLVTGEKFDRRILAPLLLALTGVAVILVPRGVELTSGRNMVGALLAFGSAFTYATLLLRSKKILRGVSSATLMTVEYVVAAIVLAPFVLAAGLRGQVPTDAKSYVALVALGVVHTAFTSFLFLGGLRRVRTDQVAVLTYIEPVSAVVFAALFLRQPVTLEAVLGGTMVVVGGLLVARLGASASRPIEIAGAGGET
jgi:drug/metabolite transporter (DMT)-like permease